MKSNEFTVEVYPQEIAEKLYELAKDMDYMDYEYDKKRVIADLEDALYVLKACAENTMNFDYFRTMYKTLERLV